MHLAHLSLAHFRNYRRLELDLSTPLVLLQGQNAQGKTNLLEAIFYLATSKSSHSRVEREVVGWNVQDEPIPYCQIGGQVRTAEPQLGSGTTEPQLGLPSPSQGQTLNLEILFTPQPDGLNFRKQVRINGVNRRAVDLIGLMRAVLFLPEDIVLVDGSPSERRRYLDIALCQIDRTYCQHLADYQKVVSQRNSLLRTLRENGTPPTAAATDAQLSFWDEKLITHGAAVLARRYRFLHALDVAARSRHADLTAGQEDLHLHYLPSFNPGHLSERDFRRLQDAAPWDRRAPARPTDHPSNAAASNAALASLPVQPPSSQDIARNFRAKLESRRARELAAGTTLYGPHRDDLRFVANHRDLRTYGSRGQQRTAALSLKLAELQVMTQETGESPILLLDDVMSELDVQRRRTLLDALKGVEQAVVTTTDWDDFTSDFCRHAQLLHVQAGQISSASS